MGSINIEKQRGTGIGEMDTDICRVARAEVITYLLMPTHPYQGNDRVLRPIPNKINFL